MCLLTLQNKPLVAEEDIIVFKMFYQLPLDAAVYSPLQHYRYVIGKEYKTEMRTSKDKSVYDRRAEVSLNLHRYNPSKRYIGAGFHAAFNIERYNGIGIYNGYNAFIYQCTVPKGSKYYTDDTDLIVSDCIIVNDVKSVVNM